jgi:hypothetical protein
MTSCILFHGPGSESEGHREALAHGRLHPFTGSDLKKDGARELVGILSQRPVVPTAVLVGPVDEVTPATSDVLLKVIEERDPLSVRPYLWAWDLGGVSSTLRSRCLLRFCPGVDARLEAYEPMARTVLKAYREGDWVTLIEEVKEVEGTDLLLRAVVNALTSDLSSPSPTPRYTALWDTLRPMFDGSPLTPARVVSAFLLADHRGSAS